MRVDQVQDLQVMCRLNCQRSSCQHLIGDILCWQSNYQSVKVSIVDNSTLADVQKLEYIMRSLRSAAAESVKGFSVVAENYEP